ncbi:unnamed protein product [Hyaloperonospora brassicae]|uniref:BED-type domain-containing protein n=1 Tax=Hyaloperonospora brassicae TaxID=162125 RepID=A0AAV0TC24_HYABA|nr:unnamed protein product [Hyaloperonospora brassicae]
MGRPLLPIWHEFETAVPAAGEKRSPDVTCRHCRALVCNARPVNLLTHASRCPEMPDEVRLRVGRSSADSRARKPTPVSLLPSEKALPSPVLLPQQEATVDETDEHGDVAAAAAAVVAGAAAVAEEDDLLVSAERRTLLGKRTRSAASTSGRLETVELVLTSIRDTMDKALEVKRQELQLRRDELAFRKEALTAKLDDRRQAREDERRDRREQREADRQERLELARIENEKNLAFLKAVMESSVQQRR